MRYPGAGGRTSIKAIAFHESLAIEKLNEYFASDESQEGEIQEITCVRCNLAFRIVVAVKADPRNTEYVGHLKSIIANDCIGGLHQDEYVFQEPGPSFRVN
jgi:hypothetical protein